MTSSLAVFEAAITGKINASDIIMLENHGNKRNFYINLRLKDRFNIEFTAF